MKKLFITTSVIVFIIISGWQLKCNVALKDFIYNFSRPANSMIEHIESTDLKSARISIPDGGKGGELIIYIDEDQPRKITVNYLGSINTVQNAFYLDTDGMFYAESKEIKYDRPLYDMEAKETENITKQYYFRNNQLLKLVINGKTVMNQCGELYEEERVYMLRELKSLLRKIETDL